jgi:hypothetical protein
MCRVVRQIWPYRLSVTHAFVGHLDLYFGQRGITSLGHDIYVPDPSCHFALWNMNEDGSVAPSNLNYVWFKTETAAMFAKMKFTGLEAPPDEDF